MLHSLSSLNIRRNNWQGAEEFKDETANSLRNTDKHIHRRSVSSRLQSNISTSPLFRKTGLYSEQRGTERDLVRVVGLGC